MAFSSILIFSTKPSTKNSIWSLASSGKWVNLDIWYLMDIWRTLGQICGWVGEIFGAERTTVVSCETRFRLEIGTWPMFTAECSDTISRAIGNLGGQMFEWPYELCSTFTIASNIIWKNEGRDGKKRQKNVQTQLVGPLATWEGKLSPKKCQESQQPTSPLNSIRIRLEFFTGPGKLQNKTIIIEFRLNIGGQILPPKDAKNAVAYFSTELSTWVK